MGDDGGDGAAHDSCAAGRDCLATLASASVEGGARDGLARSSLWWTAGAASGAGRARRWRLRQGGRANRPQDARGAARREPRNPHRAVERRAISLRWQALSLGRDDVAAEAGAVAAYSHLGSGHVAERALDGAGATLRRPAAKCAHA